MLSRLDPGQYPTVITIFQPMRIHLAIRSLLEGSTPGAILVDDPIRPHLALAEHDNRYYLAGAADLPTSKVALRDYFLESVYADRQKTGRGWFVLYVPPGPWEKIIPELMGDRNLVPRGRQYYVHDMGGELTRPSPNHRIDWRPQLPEGFVLRPVDPALLDEPIKDLDDLKEEMCSERSSVEEFLAKSFGVVLVDAHSQDRGGMLAGWCLSEYNCADYCEVGIGTQEPYRRRGFATLMGGAMIEQAQSKGVTKIGWHCFTSNQASIATALKLGFRMVTDYPAFVKLGPT
jgi:RimJ/RimL family protein N-acetyltransferase